MLPSKANALKFMCVSKQLISKFMMMGVISSALIMFALSAPAHASLAWGSINNFDTVNDTGGECHGFEIEIDDIRSTDITYTYDYNHYGVPKITQDNTDPLHPKVFVSYQSKKNLDGTWAALTIVPTGPISPTLGHQFTNPSVNFGGEHFGVGYYSQPTAVKYNWLKDDGVGNLVHAGVVIIATPTFTYVPPAGGVAAQVVAAVEPPPPPEIPVLEFGPASWVKETKTSSHNNKVVELRDLVSDDPNDPNFKNWKNGEIDEVEVEWSMLQKDFVVNGGGRKGNLAGAAENLPKGDEVITRRYDFYKYIGPIDAETGEAMGDTVGSDGKHGIGIVTYADHFDNALGEWVLITVDMSTIVVVGDYVGAQMAGFDAGAKIGLIDHLQDGEVNSPYLARSMVIAGIAPIVTTLTGLLPTGMTFDTVSGIVFGTPTVAGLYTFTIHSTDAGGGDVSKTFNLTVNGVGVNPLPHFTVNTSAASSVTGSTTGSGEFNSGINVTVLATPKAGYAFLNWTDGGAIVSTSASYSFTLGVNRDLIAHFVSAVTVKVATSASPVAGGATTGDGAYKYSDSVTVTALSNAGYAFLNWTENNTVVSSNVSYTFIANANRTLVANFVLIAQTTLTMTAVKGQVGKSVTITAVLRNKITKAPLSGKSVQFTMDGTNIGALMTTNGSGKAALPFIIPEETTIGVHTIGSVFAGDAFYALSSTTSTITVSLGAVKLTVTNISGKAGSTVVLTAKLTNASNIPMVGESIDFTVDSTLLGTGVTDATGKAALSYTIPANSVKGLHPLLAAFYGDADHSSASKIGSLTVK